jgi:16S rRNA G966 N2-methylase RsmD
MNVAKEFHSIANIFPLMEGQEFDSLCEDISKNGLYEPISIFENKILDGRNRYRACELTGVEPKFTRCEGSKEDALSCVISLNLKRRHLNESQRAVIASKLATAKRGGDRKSQYYQKADLPLDITREEASNLLNVSERLIGETREVEREAPELLPDIESGTLSVNKAKKKVREKKRNKERTDLAKAGEKVKSSERWNIWTADMATWTAPRQYDWIITDPPYPKEYVPLYEILAEKAKEWLKPGGLLVVMCGQSYLPKIHKLLGTHLEYYWEACYRTPGQPTPLRQRSVNSSWKPLLIYSNGDYTGKIFGDVFRSGANDKDFHKWGQSVSGMTSIIKGMCLSGQYILDPFCGAGTTGVAAISCGCFFDGIDNDKDSVNIAKVRLSGASKAAV